MLVSDKIQISLNNSKLGDKIPSLNLSVFKSCRKDAPCLLSGKCYALKGRMRLHQEGAYKNNYDAYIENSDLFFKTIQDWLNDDDVIFKFFRWFGSGDIVDYKFLLGMIETAKACPQTRFMAFTKKHDLVNMYLALGHQLPQNLKIIFSAWDKDFKINNPYNLPVAFIDLKDKEKNASINEYAIPCRGSCKSCKSCWSLVNGQAVLFPQH